MFKYKFILKLKSKICLVLLPSGCPEGLSSITNLCEIKGIQSYLWGLFPTKNQANSN